MEKKRKIPWAVLIAILLGIAAGSVLTPSHPFYLVIDVIGRLFINALTMVVLPLVVASIVSSIIKVGGEGQLGRLGAKTFACYLFTNLTAILVGLLFVNLIQPGVGGSAHALLEQVKANAPESSLLRNGPQLLPLILQIVPANIFSALSQGQMISIIVFSLLLGFAIARIGFAHRQILSSFFQALLEAMLTLTKLVMYLLPIGVFCLVAKGVATTGWNAFVSLGWFVLTTLLALTFFSSVVLPAFVKLLGRISPLKLVKAVSPALVTAFSTSSSAASLPVTMECIEERVGVSNRVTGLVVPLGSSLNMSGSALYECVAALFVAQLYGVELSFVTQFLVLLLSLVTSMGIAGVPAASIVAVVVILKAMGLPEEAVGLFMAVDRLLDMARTTVNVFSDSCCAVIVARLEGEQLILKK